MAIKGVTNYIKNVTRSVQYAAADILKSDLVPNVAEFASDNQEFLVSTYSALRNPKSTLKKQIVAMQNSKVYQALDYGVRNTVEDLKSGNFYNKERMNRDADKFDGFGDFDDLSDFGISSNDYEDIMSGKSSSKKESSVTDGDLKIVNAIEGTSAANSNATVNAIIATSNAQVQSARINNSMIYMQNEKLFNGLHNDLSVIGATLDSMHKITSASLQNIDKNVSDFFTQELRLDQERNAMLKEMLEMQRNMYTSAADKEKTAANKSSSGKKKLKWKDIQYDGVADIDSYFKAVKDNIAEGLSFFTSMGSMMGDNSNILASMMVSPIQSLVKGVVKGIIPATVKAAAHELDQSFTGIFGNIMADLANSKDDFFSIKGILSSILGINPDADKRVNTSKYEKGTVPFDGITRRAIINVIPAYLARIESTLTGNSERIYDFEKGKWTTMKAVRSNINDIRHKSVMGGTRSIREQMSDGINKVTASNPNDRESITAAFNELWEFIYDRNGRFDPSATPEQNRIDKKKYPNLYANYNMVCTVMVASRIQQVKVGDKMQSRQVYSTQLKLPKEVMDAKAREDQMYRNIESGLNVMSQHFESIDVSGKNGGYIQDKGGFGLFTKDRLGNTVFDYLQNINRELILQRQYGVGGGGVGTRNGTAPMSDADLKKAMGSIDLTNSNLKRQRASANRKNQIYNNEVRKRVLDTISKGEALDISKINDEDSLEYLYYLYGLYSAGNSTAFKWELNGYDAGIIATFFNKHFYHGEVKSLNDIRNSVNDLADDERDNTKAAYLKQIFNNTLGKAGNKLGNIFGTTGDEFTRMLYSADKAIYDMMYKHDLKDDSGHRYEGFMDMLAGKLTETFNETSNKVSSFLKDKFEKLKEYFKFNEKKEKVLAKLKGDATSLWQTFVGANKEVWGPYGKKVMDAMGIDLDSQKQSTTSRRKRKNTASTSDTENEETEQTDLTPEERARAAVEEQLKNRKENSNSEQARKRADRWTERRNKIAEKEKQQQENVLKEKRASRRKGDYDVNAENAGADTPTNASGTIGTFAGRSALSKGEVFINKFGAGTIDKTGVYDVTTPSVILNARDSYALGLTKDQPDTISESLRKEKYVANKAGYNISSNGIGTVNVGGKEIDVDGMLNEAKTHVPEAASGAVIGAGLGLIGGPGGILGGAALGAAVNLIRGSENAKKFLFGDIDEETGKRNGGGVISKKVVDFANKNVPDMAKYGLAGIIPGAILGFGPVAGLAIGAGIGLLKNSTTIKDKLFGDEGIIGQAEKDILKDIGQKGKKGAIIGGLAGVASKFLLGTPGIGILGGAVLGAGIGIMNSSDEFKEHLFGTIGSDGKREGGLLGMLGSAFQPLRDATEEFREKLNQTLEEGFVQPLKDFVTPFIHELPRMLTFLPRKIGEWFEGSALGKALQRKVDDWLGRPVKWVTNKILKPVSDAALNIIKLPGKGLSAIGNKIRKGQIIRGDAEYMTAEERLEFARNNKMYNDKNYNAAYDEQLAAIGSEGGMSLDDAINLRTNLSVITDTRAGLAKQRKNAGNDLVNILDNYKVDGVGLNSKTLKKAKKAIDAGDVDKVADIIREGGLQGRGAALTQEQFNNLFKSEGLENSILKYNDLKNREYAINNTDKGAAKQALMEDLKKAGVNIDDNAALQKYIKNLDTEINRVRASNPQTTEEIQEDKEFREKEKEVQDAVVNINKNIEEFMKAFKKDTEGTSQYLVDGNESAQAAMDKSIKESNDAYSQYQYEVTEGIDGVNQEIAQKLGTSKYKKNVKQANRRNMTGREVNLTGGKKVNYDRLNMIKTIGNGEFKNLSDEIIKKISSMSKTEYKRLRKFLENDYLIALCKPSYKLTLADLNFISTHYIFRDEFYSLCELNYKNGITMKRLKSFDGIFNSKPGMTEASRAIDEAQYEAAEAAEQEQKEPEEIASNGLGTIIGSLFGPVGSAIGGVVDTAGSVVKGAVRGVAGLAGKAANGLNNLIDNGKSNGGVSGALSSLLGNGTNSGGALNGSGGGGDFDETDKPGDGRDLVHVGDGQIIHVKKDGSGNVEPDTADSKTKDVMNKLSLKEKLENKAREAQIKSMEILKNAFDVSDDQQAKANKWSWWKLLLLGGFLWKSGIIQKLFNKIIKPLWEDYVQPAINKFTEYLVETVLPNIVSGAISLLGDFIKQLPSIMQDVWLPEGGFATAIRNGITSAILKLFGKDDDDLSDYYDQDGNQLTNAQFKNGEYESAYTENGEAVTVDDNGTIRKDGKFVWNAENVINKALSIGQTALYYQFGGLFNDAVTGRNDTANKIVDAAKEETDSSTDETGSGSNYNKPLAIYGRATEAVMQTSSANITNPWVDYITNTTIDQDTVEASDEYPNTYWSDISASNLSNFKNKLLNTINTPLIVVQDVVNSAADSMDYMQSWIIDRLSAVSTFISDPTGSIIGWITTENKTTNNNPGSTKITSNVSSTAPITTKVISSTVSSSNVSSSSSSSNSTAVAAVKKANSTSLFGKIKNFLFGSGTTYNTPAFGMGFSKQIDPSISSIRFNANGDHEYQTIGDSGCGPAAAVNAMEAIYGRGGSDVVNAAKYAVSRGYKEQDGGTRPEFFNDYFAQNGYSSQTTSNRNTLMNNIKAGLPTVLMGKDSNGVSARTPYGRTPHYVTATGVDANGHVIIQDPESKYDNQLYSMNDVLRKTSFGVSAFGKRYGRGKYGRGKTNIIIGDSRCTMTYCALADANTSEVINKTTSDGTVWFCKVGMGYSWMKGTALTAAESLMTSGANVIIMMGVNDLYNKDNYATLMNSLVKEYPNSDIYFVTVNPVSKTGYKNSYGSITNDDITEFNDTVKSKLNGVKYIDTYSKVITYSYKTTDDLHYDNDTSLYIYDLVMSSVNGETASTTSNYSSTGSSTTTTTTTDDSFIGKMTNILANSKIGQAFKKITGSLPSSSSTNSANTTNNNSSSSSSYSSSSSSSSSSSGNYIVSGSGEFPKYNLTDDQIKGVANIVGHEQGTEAGWLAEASLMANRTDIKGDEYATPENLVKAVTGGWFAYGSKRYYQRDKVSDGTVQAVKTAIVEGKRTVPRYVNEHDYIGDILSVTTNGKSISKNDRDAYIRHQTQIKNTYGSDYTFYSWPNPEGDPFGYTDTKYREKWGDACYGTGKYGRGKDSNASQIWWYLKQSGMSDAGAAGILGNFEAESGIEPTNLQNSYESSLGYTDESYTKAVDDGSYGDENFATDAAGYGLAQFTYNTFKRDLLTKARSNNKSIGSLSNQTEYLVGYLKDSVPSVWESLANSATPEDAAAVFMTKYEKPADQSYSAQAKRGEKARAWYDKLKGTSGTEMDDTDINTDGVSSSNSTSSIDTNTATNVEQSFVDKMSDILKNSNVGKAFYKIIGIGNSNETTSSSDSSSNSSSSSGSTVTAAGDASAFLQVAANEVGYKETGDNYTKYGGWIGQQNQPWCASFVSWCGDQAGLDKSVIPHSALAQDFTDHYSVHPDPTEAAPGDIITFDTNHNNYADHVGIVESNDGSTIYTIEGNYNDQVAKVSRPMSNKADYTIGRPNFPTSTNSTTTNTSSIAAVAYSPTASVYGGNNNKPLARFGQFNESIHGKGAIFNTKKLSTKDAFGNIGYTEMSPDDQKLAEAARQYNRKFSYVKNYGLGTKNNDAQYGRATITDYSKLINSIITILYTIADNTDKLNLIVTILNNKLGTDITSSDVANASASNTETLKQKLQTSLNNTATQTSKLNSIADTIGDSSMNSIIAAMNAIASE